jgi:hypothetical protein
LGVESAEVVELVSLESRRDIHGGVLGDHTFDRLVARNVGLTASPGSL